MSEVVKGELVYEGKAKKIYSVKNEEEMVWVEFKDSLTAFNAQKKGSFPDKGLINRKISSLIFQYLIQQGVPTHWLEDLGEREMLVKKVRIVPLEVVVRNRLAGSTAKKFGLEEGTAIDRPLIEFFYKSDELGDPFLSDDQALMLKTVSSRAELDELRILALAINSHLVRLFNACNIDLIDFKLEFGRLSDGQLVLADEISPDSCRLWDKSTGEKLDKDRFRRDLGGIEESYRDVLKRLQTAKEKC